MDQQKKEPSSTLIYVSNLPFNTTDEQFKDLFKGYSIKTAYIAKRKNGKSKGFGFVNLEKESEQKEAIEKVNGKELESRKLIAKIAMNDERRNENGELKEEFKTQTKQGTPSETVVYVSNLAWTVNDEELKKIFAEFNPKSVTVATRRNGRSKGFGFVEFNNKEDREKALSLDQKTFSERQITVKQSTGFKGDKPRDNNNNNNNKPRSNNNNSGNRKYRDNNNNNNNRRRKNPTRRDNDRNDRNDRNNNNNNRNNDRPPRENRGEFTLYVNNLPFELDDIDLKDVFADFNPKSARIAINNGKSKGYGFVEFNNSKDQNDALRALDQSEINDRLVTVKISTPVRRNRRSRSPVNREASVNTVHVSNLDFSIDDKDLGEIFKGLNVTKSYVVKTKNGRSKGFGFVEFKTSDDQAKSIKKTGEEVKGRAIKVQASYARDNNNNK